MSTVHVKLLQSTIKRLTDVIRVRGVETDVTHTELIDRDIAR